MACSAWELSAVLRADGWAEMWIEVWAEGFRGCQRDVKGLAEMWAEGFPEMSAELAEMSADGKQRCQLS